MEYIRKNGTKVIVVGDKVLFRSMVKEKYEKTL